MTTSQALTVSTMAKDGYGAEDICVKLKIKPQSDDAREIRRYVLGLKSKVAGRYGA